MARKRVIPAQPTLVQETRHLAHIWQGNGRLAFLSDAPQCGSGFARVAVIDIGRPFRHHVASLGTGPSGLVIDGMTGDNAKPWPPSQILSAARYGLFGFKLVEGS